MTGARLAPVLGLLALVAVLAAWGLHDGASPLTAGTARAAPAFTLPRLDDPGATLTRDDLVGRVALVNVWATWCVPCRQEHQALLAIARDSGVPIFGLNYRDRPDHARRWLATLGNPYVATGLDADGAAAAGFGARGAPETYVIDRNGRIAHRHVGPLTAEVWRDTLSTLVERLRAS